tara:strand:+ start:3527 stop:4009 length:483 start_codon:yes stop_codon:yes gene_type:complete
MLFKKIRKAIYKKSYVLIKNAVQLESFKLDFDFNMMFALYGKHNNLKFQYKVTPFVGQIFDLNSIPLFKTYLDYIATHLGDLFEIGSLDFFYSIKGEVGPAHQDREHVIILGIKNITYYHIDNVDLKIEPGDIVYVPKGYLHHAFSPRERIILSLSLWKK